MRGVIYVRLSKDDAKNPSLSPENQEKINRNKAMGDGNEIIEVYRDINKSGTNLFRKELQKLMNDAKRQLFEVVYLKDWSRLSRDSIDQETVVRELKGLGIEIISCDGVSDKKARQVIGLSNEWSIDKNREDTEKLHQLKIKEGKPINRSPIGYKYNAKDNGVFIIDKKKAKVVKKLFELTSQNISIKDLEKEFKIGRATLYKILRNKTYAGKLRYRDIIYQGHHEPIISKKLFEEVQKTNESRSRKC